MLQQVLPLFALPAQLAGVVLLGVAHAPAVQVASTAQPVAHLLVRCVMLGTHRAKLGRRPALLVLLAGTLVPLA